MKYHGVCIAVSDVKLSQKFYEELFGLVVFQDYGTNISFSGGLSLQQGFDEIVGIPKDTIVVKPHNMELYFEEDDFDGFISKLEQRNDISYIADGVKEAEWGQRSVRFYDLDGHIIEVGENLTMVIRRFLDSGMSMEDTSERMGVSISDLEKLLSA
jgi:catechol 2,3-dioxygenase-like lactoylglutathione lyase family enzyme